MNIFIDNSATFICTGHAFDYLAALEEPVANFGKSTRTKGCCAKYHDQNHVTGTPSSLGGCTQAKLIDTPTYRTSYALSSMHHRKIQASSTR